MRNEMKVFVLGQEVFQNKYVFLLERTSIFCDLGESIC